MVLRVNHGLPADVSELAAFLFASGCCFFSSVFFPFVRAALLFSLQHVTVLYRASGRALVPCGRNLDCVYFQVGIGTHFVTGVSLKALRLQTKNVELCQLLRSAVSILNGVDHVQEVF